MIGTRTASPEPFVVFVDDRPNGQHEDEQAALEHARRELAAHPNARIYYRHGVRVEVVREAPTLLTWT